jgi:hypothetical protein
MRRTARDPRTGLAAALLLLVALASAMLLTGTATRSPVRVWTTWAWEMRYRAFPVAEAAELAGIHANARAGSREQCVSCHGDKTDSKLLVHRIHLTSELFPDLACHECHTRVDLGARSSTTTAQWVDVGFCKRCHSAFPGLTPGSRMRPEDFDADCTMCHTGERAIRHAQPYLSQVIPTQECRGCHGGRVLPWTARHEQGDWLQVHGEEALLTGTDGCFACHDFGLKFCDDCHAQKPPSHIPAERWRTIHSDAARADTRVCYTCHPMSWCKTCHINHEAGWLTGHRAYVAEHGKASCTECHSLSACTFCHTASPDDPSGPSAAP